MLKLYFLLGDRKPEYLSEGENLLINILDRLSMYHTAYTIDYCYDRGAPPSRKADRAALIDAKRNDLKSLADSEIVIVGMGWMATEVLFDVPKIHMSQVIGCRFPVPPFKYDTWFTYDPNAALFDPNLYVDIMGCISAAIRYAGRPIVINTQVKPFKWPEV